MTAHITTPGVALGSRSTVTIWGVATLSLMALVGCAPQSNLIRQDKPKEVWTATFGLEHPLIGQIFSVRKAETIAFDELVSALEKRPYVLIGERHDHPDHHRLQARTLRALLSLETRPVAYEMLDEDDAEHIVELASAEQLASRVNWDKSGWPAFSMYAPVFEATIKANGQVVAALPRKSRIREHAMAAYTSSQPVVDSEAKKHLSPAALDTLRDDIETGHCGYANEAMVAAMVKVQTFKDRWMAKSLTDASTKAVLIAGNGHVRKDYGIPNVLPGQTLSIGIVEVDDKHLRVQDYPLERYDFIWFTPRIDETDPCDVFREQLEQMRHPGAGSPK